MICVHDALLIVTLQLTNEKIVVMITFMFFSSQGRVIGIVHSFHKIAQYVVFILALTLLHFVNNKVHKKDILVHAHFLDGL